MVLHTEATKPSFERAVVLYNPSGENLAHKYAEQLRASRLGVAVTKLPTVAGGVGPNTELLQRELRAGDAVGTVCGDGTFRDIAGAISQLALADVLVTALGGGNACDIRKALHGVHRLPAPEIFATMVAVQARLLQFCIQCPDTAGPAIELAASYSGWGKTGTASKRVNRPAYRNGLPFIRDVGIMTHIILSNESAWLLNNNNEVVEVGNLLFGKGSRIAKLGTLPIEHWDDRMYVSATDPGFIAAVHGVLAVKFGEPSGAYEFRAAPYNFITGSPVVAHFDGEHRFYPALTEVTASLTEATYIVGTTRLTASE